MMGSEVANRQKWTLIFLAILLGMTGGIVATVASYRYIADSGGSKATRDAGSGIPWIGIDIQVNIAKFGSF